MAGTLLNTYTGGTVLRNRVEVTSYSTAPFATFGSAVATNTLTFDGGYFKMFETSSHTQQGALVNNLVVNALNERASDVVATACRFVDAIESRHVGEIHLAGYDDHGALVIDDHGSRVHAPVWQVYAHAIRRHGMTPTLVEWDTSLPDFSVLLGEAHEADRMAAFALDKAAA